MGWYFNARTRLHISASEPRYVMVKDPVKAYEDKRRDRRCGHVIGHPDVSGDTPQWRVCDEQEPCLWHWTAVIRNLATFAKQADISRHRLGSNAPFADRRAAEAASRAWRHALGIALMDMDGERSYVPDAAIQLGGDFLAEHWGEFQV